ncbi:TPA: GntR family transcriptional regulator [Burkholderia multivorans]|nr:GntR family transcriptional regulator [Burkholderia multivorans]
MPTNSPSPLQIDLSKRIVELVRSGQLAVGAHVSEAALCESFQVSRSPVRGAMKLVSELGFLEYRVNAGYVVAAQWPADESGERDWERITSDDLCRAMVRDRAANSLPKAFTESLLFERYGASRSVLSKALVKLAQEGLIEKRQGHGWQFHMTFDSIDTVEESYRFRIMTECAGLLEQTFAVDQDKLEEMKRAHEVMLGKLPDLVTAAEFYALNSSFHEMLARFSGNRFVVQAAQQQNLLRRLDEHAAFQGLGPHAILSCQEHLAIIEALEQGDREWAASILRRHLTRASDAKRKRLSK